jgi:hypothetical protein
MKYSVSIAAYSIVCCSLFEVKQLKLGQMTSVDAGFIDLVTIDSRCMSQFDYSFEPQSSLC